MSQKTPFFIVTAVKTSNLTNYFCCTPQHTQPKHITTVASCKGNTQVSFSTCLFTWKKIVKKTAIRFHLMFHSNNYEEYYLLECSNAYFGICSLMFPRNVLPESLGYKNTPSSSLASSCLVLGYGPDPEHTGSTFHWHAAKRILNYTVLCPTRLLNLQFKA
jgi:hypothetical protein